MEKIIDLIEEYTALRKNYKHSYIQTFKKYFLRVLWHEQSRTESYKQLILRDAEYWNQSRQIIRNRISAIESKEIKEALIFLNAHILGLEERRALLILYGVTFISIIAVYTLLENNALVILLLLAGTATIAERGHTSARIRMLKDFKIQLEFETGRINS